MCIKPQQGNVLYDFVDYYILQKALLITLLQKFGLFWGFFPIENFSLI